MIATGCAAGETSPKAGPPGGIIECGERPTANGGSLVQWYAPSMLNAALAEDPGLRANTGLDRVESCEDAQYVSLKRLEIEERTLGSEQRAEPEVALPPIAGTGGTDELVDKIYHGTLAGSARAVVTLGLLPLTYGCTGTLLNKRTILTAGHCINASVLVSDVNGDGVNDQGHNSVAIGYRGNCLSRQSGSTSGACRDGYTFDYTDFADAVVVVNPDFDGTPADAQDDIGLMLFVSDLPGLSTVDFATVEAPDTVLAAGNDFRVFGAGFTDNDGSGLGGALRTDADFANIDWLGSLHLISDAKNAGGVRMCEGDSGGPAFLKYTGTSRQTSLGVYSGGVGLPGVPCIPSGNKQRWTRTAPKASWISDWATLFAGHSVCSTVTSAEAPRIKFMQCF